MTTQPNSKPFPEGRPWTVVCPYCGAKPGESCRTLPGTQNVRDTKTHNARWRIAAQ